MKLRTIVIAIALGGISQVSLASDPDREQRRSAASGLVVGAIAGGPAGAFAGAIIGGEVFGRLFKHKRVARELGSEVTKLEQDLVSQRALYTQQVASLNSDLDKLISIQSRTSDSRSLPIQFKTASSAIEDQYDAELQKVAELLQRNRDASITLTGYSDRRGDELYNQELSEARVRSLEEFLISAGVDQSQINATALGESRPLESTESLEGNFFDRRVLLEVHLDIDPQLATR